MAAQNKGPVFISQAKRAFWPGSSISQQPGWFVTKGANIYAGQNENNSGGANINGTGMYKSTDFGNTWNQLDAADAPLNAEGAPVYDVANNRILWAMATITFPSTTQPLFMQPFNLATETWGAAFATGGPNIFQNPNSIFIRPDNSIVVFYDFGSGNPGGTSRLRATVWNGSSWTASIDVGVNMIATSATGQVIAANVAAVMDSTGLIHVFFRNNANTQNYYQQFTTSNTLGQFNVLGLTLSGSVGFASAIITPGNTLMVSFCDPTFTNNKVLIGSNLTAPTFSVSAPANLAYPGGFINLPGPIVADGTKIYWNINTFDPTFVYVRIQIAISSDNGATWVIPADQMAIPFFYDFEPGGSPVDPNADPTFGVNNPLLFLSTQNGGTVYYALGEVRNTPDSLFLGYLMNASAQPSPPVVVSNVNVPGGGGDQVERGGCKPLNYFDLCLLREMRRLRSIRPLHVCSVPREIWTILPWEDDFLSLPAEAVPFKKIQSIVTPAPAAGDTVVSQLVVPQGYDGIVAGVFWKYSGTGFIEGSGDIIWRIQVNMRFVKDLSNVFFTLGSSVDPLPMTDGQLLQSRQRVSIIVNVPNGSGLIQVGASNIIGGLIGFYWPRGMSRWVSR